MMNVKPYSTLDNPIVVPVQKFAYEWARDNVLLPDEAVLDVGFGLGYGLDILYEKTSRVWGIEIDRRAFDFVYNRTLYKPYRLYHYSGLQFPFSDSFFEVVTCIDVLEHVPDYSAFIKELVRVSTRAVVISTPNRRPENTNADGTPKNYHHLREWTYPELADILSAYTVQWQFINYGSGQYSIGGYGDDTQALLPVIFR